MAENDKLLEELKEIADSFKNMGKYTQDLQQALTNMVRPMQQMSDYMKAISKETEDSQKAQKEMMADMVQMLLQMREATDALKERKNLTEQEKELRRQNAETLLKIRQIELERQEAEKKSYEESKENNKRTDLQNKALAHQKGIVGSLVVAANEYYAGLARAAYETDKNGQAVSRLNAEYIKLKAAMAGSDIMFGAGGGGPGAVVQSLAKGMSGMMPTMGLGGLVGMMIYGVGQDEHFRSVGEKAAQVFDQVGGHSNKLTSDLASASRGLSKWGMAAEEDLLSVTSALAQSGVSSDEARQKLDGFSSVVGNNLVIATLAADKAFEMASGSMARMAGAMAGDFNMTIKESVAAMMNLGAATRIAGFNAANLMQQAMQAASALKLLNANGADVGTTMLGVAKGMVGAGFGKQFSQQYAAAGAQSAMGGIANMGEGLSAIVGENLGYGSGLDALYAMKSPKGRGADEKFDIGAIIGEMKGIVEGMSSNRSEQAFALTKLLGVDMSGADYILDAMKEQAETGKLSVSTQKNLQSAFESEGQKTNQMLQMVEVIKDAVAHVSVGLLMMVINGLKLIFDGLMMVGAKLASAFTTGPESKAYAQVANLYSDILENDAAGADKGYNRISKGLGQLGKAIGKEFDIFEGTSGSNSADKRRQVSELLKKTRVGGAAVAAKENPASTAAISVAEGAGMGGLGKLLIKVIPSWQPDGKSYNSIPSGE